MPVLPEPVIALMVSVSEFTLSLNWTYQSSGSQRRTGAEVVIEGGGVFTRLTAEETSVTLSSLCPLTNYTVTVYALSMVGRSQPTSTEVSTPSLSKLGVMHCQSVHHAILSMAR